MPTIVPSTELRNNYNAISKLCREKRRPVFITKNGHGDLAVMSIEMYEAWAKNLGESFDGDSLEESRQELYRLLEEGRNAVNEERVLPLDEAVADTRKRYTNGAV